MRHTRQTRPLTTLLLAAAIALPACVINRKETELQTAVKAHDVEAVKRLLASGAPLKASLDEVDGPYELALLSLDPREPRSVEVLRLMIARMDKSVESGEGTVGVSTAPKVRPADFTFRSNLQRSTAADTTSAVEIAARQWSADGVKVLIEHGLTIKSEAASDALVAAAGNGCVPAIRHLLDAGADPNRPDRKGDTALRMARRVRNASAAAYLLGRGARGPKAGTEDSAAKKKVENILGSIIAPGAGGNPEDAPGQIWLEGADVVRHPIGKAALELGVPQQDLERGSALIVKDYTAELHVFIPPVGTPAEGAPAPPDTAMHTLVLDKGKWVFRAES